jgi:hypothetical protein
MIDDYLKIHFQDFTYTELRDILMNEEVMMRASTLPNHYYVFLEKEKFEKLKLSLLVDQCLVQENEKGNDIEVSRPHLKLGEQNA